MSDTTFKGASPEFHSALVDCIPDLRAFAQSLTRNRDQAGDLVNDAAVRALRASHQFSPGTNFKAWMFTILRNLYYNEGRKNHSRNVPFDDATVAGRPFSTSHESTIEFCDFQRAFRQLGEDHREVLMLVAASGLSYEEAAKACNCAAGTIKSRVWRARQRLTALLSDNAPAVSRKESAAITSAMPAREGGAAGRIAA